MLKMGNIVKNGKLAAAAQFHLTFFCDKMYNYNRNLSAWDNIMYK